MSKLLEQESITDRLIGFGLDYKYADRYSERGLAGLCAKYRTRLSHLSIVSLRNQSEARSFKTVAMDLPVIHHLSNVAPANPDGPNLERLAIQDAISRELKALWCGEDIGIWSLGPYEIPYFAPPAFEPDVATHVSDGIMKIMRNCSVPFLAEVPSCSFVAGRLTLGEFFHRLVDCTGCPLVLDVSHVYSYGLATGQSASSVLHSLPLKSTWEIHIAGGRINQDYPFRYVDTHSHPILDEVLALLAEAVKFCPNLACVTYEIGVQLPGDVIETDLRRLECTLQGVGFVPNLSSRLTK